jgi:phenylalanyl-tRNA synthetase alpha chain
MFFEILKFVSFAPFLRLIFLKLMAGFLNEIEPLKQTALANSRPRPTSPRWNKPRARGSAPNGKFTALMKQLGTLSKGGKARRRQTHQRRQGRTRSRARRTPRRTRTQAALPKEPTDFTLPGRRRALGKLHPLTQVTEDIVRASARSASPSPTARRSRTNIIASTRSTRPPTIPRATRRTRFILQTGALAEILPPPGERAGARAGQILFAPHPHLVRPNPRDGKAAAARAHHRAGPRLSPRQRRRHAQSHLPPDRGLYVDKNVTVGDLKGTVEFVFKELLGSDVKIRFRPHYFSYTEPSFEIDFSNALVKKMGKDWLEIAGCGMVHPQVFENVGYDPEVWTGWAFGFGIERIAMIRYGINDIRLFYENDVRFLKQF